MKKIKTHALLSVLSFLLMSSMVTSCSTRKVVTSIVKKENDIENLEIEKKALKVKENSNVKITNDVTQTEETATEKKTYSPIDPTKPSSFTDDKGNKKELNNTSYTEEKTTSKSYEKRQNKTESSKAKTTKDKGAKRNSTRTKGKEASKGKNIIRTSFSWWWLLLLLIPIGIYVFRRWRDKIWWV
jgi:hypothetical protein